MNIKGMIDRIRRVFMIASKPDKDEFKQSVKITGLGFLVIGFIGFLIFLIFQLTGLGAL